MTRRRLIVLLATTALVVGACSVPRDSEARIVTNPHPPTSAPVTTIAGSDMPRTTAKVYFIRSSDDLLEGVTTSVRVPSSPSVVLTALARLEALIVDGPQEKRLESKIPNTATFEVRHNGDDQLIVILQNWNVRSTNRETLVLAFQQMVYTLTEIPEINRVQFSVSTALYPVPLKSGQVKQVGTGVRRSDYDTDTIFETTTTTSTSTTTAPAPTSTAPATTPGPSGPTSAPGPPPSSR